MGKKKWKDTEVLVFTIPFPDTLILKGLALYLVDKDGVSHVIHSDTTFPLPLKNGEGLIFAVRHLVDDDRELKPFTKVPPYEV